MQVLGAADTGDPSGRRGPRPASIDQIGPRLRHPAGRRARRRGRRIAATGPGAARSWLAPVDVVTDHGWILLPAAWRRSSCRRDDRGQEGPLRAAQGGPRCRRPDCAVALGQGRADRYCAGHHLLRGEQDLRARRCQPPGVRRSTAIVSPRGTRPDDRRAPRSRGSSGSASCAGSSSPACGTASKVDLRGLAGGREDEHRREGKGDQRRPEGSRSSFPTRTSKASAAYVVVVGRRRQRPRPA